MLFLIKRVIKFFRAIVCKHHPHEIKRYTTSHPCGTLKDIAIISRCCKCKSRIKHSYSDGHR